MGFLLMQYEYQRANVQVNMLECAGIRIDNQLNRYAKRVEKMEGIFQKAQDRLNRDWENASKMYSMNITNAANLGDTAALEAAINSIIIGGMPLSAFISVGSAPTINADPNDQAAVQRATLTYLSSVASQAQQVLTQLITNAKEADLEQLQDQQDEQLYPIADKQNDLEREQASNEALLTLWQSRKDKAHQRLGQDIDSSVANFGLK